MSSKRSKRGQAPQESSSSGVAANRHAAELNDRVNRVTATSKSSYTNTVNAQNSLKNAIASIGKAVDELRRINNLAMQQTYEPGDETLSTIKRMLMDLQHNQRALGAAMAALDRTRSLSDYQLIAD